jgi:hypothetical protein
MSGLGGESKRYGDGGARLKEFDANPLSLFFSEVGESPGQGLVDKIQVAGKESSANNAQRWWCIRELVFKRQSLERTAEGAVQEEIGDVWSSGL